MVALEAAMTAKLGEAAEMDGHDAGTDALFLFIFTDDPEETFAQLKPLLEGQEQLEWMTATYREAKGDHYTLIWPPNGRKAMQIA
jgi:hypothetical protein